MLPYPGYTVEENQKRWDAYSKNRNCPECDNDHIYWRRNNVYRQCDRALHKELFVFRAKCTSCATQWQSPFADKFLSK